MCHLNCYFIKAPSHLSYDFSSLLKDQLCPHPHSPPHFLQLHVISPFSVLMYQPPLCHLFSIYCMLLCRVIRIEQMPCPHTLTVKLLKTEKCLLSHTSDYSLCSCTPETFVDWMTEYWYCRVHYFKAMCAASLSGSRTRYPWGNKYWE